MNRRFNYTGRVRITRDQFTIRLSEDSAGGPPSFDADLSGLKEMGFDANARVIVEAYVRQSSMRFDFGTIEIPSQPASRRLTEIDRGAVVQFRIKVVDMSTKAGRLLALADQIRALTEVEGDDRKSILPLAQRDLGEAVWKIEVGKDESPVLVLNKRIADLASRLADDAVVQGAVFSAAIRDVLRVALLDEIDHEQEWVRDWREFTEGLYGGEIPELSDDSEAENSREDFIDKVVDRFCARERWATLAQPAAVGLEGEDE